MVAYTWWPFRPRASAVASPIPELVPVMSTDAMVGLPAASGVPESVGNSRTRCPRRRVRGRSKLDEFRSGTSSVLPVLLLIRLLFRRLLLRLHGPGWDDAIHSRVRHQLPKVLVCIRDQNVNHIPRVRLRTQLRQ